MDYDDYFDEKCEEIKAKYGELNLDPEFDLGWTFLMSSRKTLSPKTKIAFITLNPGGGEKEKPVHSCDGAAYLYERWNKDGKSPFQVQIQKLFEGLHERIGKQPYVNDYKDLMNNTLCSQYIPFRSKDYASLPEKKLSKKFSDTLWKNIFSECIRPKLVITLSVETFYALSRILQDENSGYTLLNKFEINTEWNNTLARFNVFKDADGTTCTLAGLPHLSTFKIFSATSEETQNATKNILDKMTENFN